MEEKMEGKRSIGRSRIGMIDHLIYRTYAELKRRVEEWDMEGSGAKNQPKEN